MNRTIHVTRAASAIVGVMLVCSTAFADVKLSMHAGRVSVEAKDATLRQILAEWAKIGGTKIVNIDKIPGGPLTIVLHEVSERQALDILLRTVSGYIAAPRTVLAANLSQFDRIMILPTSFTPPAPSTLAATQPPTSASSQEPTAALHAAQPAESIALDVTDTPPSNPVEVPANEPGQSNPARQGLEVVDPRFYKLPAGVVLPGRRP
jgi:hypothetical protein